MSNHKAIKQAERHIAQLTKSHEELFRKKEVLEKGIRSINSRLLEDRDKLAELRLQDMAAGVDWVYLLQENNSQVTYKELQLQLQPLGLRNNGYYHQTNQRCLSFSLYKKDDEHTKLVASSLRMLLPFLLPLPDGYIHVDFMEKTLSESGSYDLYLKSDLTGYINCRRWGHDRVVKTGTLDELLACIQQSHYLSKKSDGYY